MRHLLSWVNLAGGCMTSNPANLQDACLGVATALIFCKPLPGGIATIIGESLPGVRTLRVSLVDKGGDHLLHYPVVEREGPVEGPIRAVAKCKQGTAAWQAFQLSHLLRSDQHPDRCHAFVDWESLKQKQDVGNCVTLPLEAPEGMLGAVTVLVSGCTLASELLAQLTGLAAHLALCLTHVKCRHDLEMALSALRKAYPAEALDRLLPDSATSGPMPLSQSEGSASPSIQSELEADGSSISDSSDDCETMILNQIARPQMATEGRLWMPYPSGHLSKPGGMGPAEYYKSWIHEFCPSLIQSSDPPSDKQSGHTEHALLRHAIACCGGQQVVDSRGLEDRTQQAHVRMLHDHGQPQGIEGQCSSQSHHAPCWGAGLMSSDGGVPATRSHGRASPYRAQPPVDASSGGGRARRPQPVASQRIGPSVVPERADKARPRMGGHSGSHAEPHAFRVQCTQPSCGAVMHVLPEDLGLEPVNLEAVELEAVSRAEVLASDPALLSETPGAPSFKQNWDLTYTKSRLEHKFCAWQYGRLGSVDTVHAFLMMTVPLFLILWPLRNADACPPALPRWVNGFFASYGLALLLARSYWTGYAQHREQLTSAERLVVPLLCLFVSLMQGSATRTDSPISSWIWAMGGLVYVSVLRRVRWRVHMTLLLPEACMRVTAAIAASICRQGHLMPGLPMLTCLQGLAACTLPAIGIYICERQARRNFVRNICKFHLD
ncbi:g6506 [Coccomyxa elongata]